jgi:predicted dehydrogenase
LLFLLSWYLGTPVEVRATWNRLYGEHEDEMHGTLKLANGVDVGFDTSWSVPGYPSPATVIEMEGTNGKMLASDDALELDLLVPRHGYPLGITRLGHADLPGVARFELDGDAPYLQDASFLAWVTGGEAPPARGDRALAIVRTIDALYASAREGGRPMPVAP